MDQLSYVPFYVSMLLPLIVFGIDSRMRKDFWRSRAGEHFPSDIALGTVVGVGMGMLVPRFHMPKKLARRVSFTPMGPMGPGLTLAYTFR